MKQDRRAPRGASPCLVLMFKAPERSKQRLAARIGPLAADLAERLCGCALEDLDGWPGPLCLAAASRDDVDWLVSCPAHRSAGRTVDHVVVQADGNLGERLNHINERLAEAGYTNQIFIGIDCPELDGAYLAAAAHALEDYDAALGPARDGGVVLMAARRLWPPLEALDWSGPNLARELAALCRAQGWRVGELPTRSDVDTLEDLAPLERALRADGRPARRRLVDWLELHEPALKAAGQ